MVNVSLVVGIVVASAMLLVILSMLIWKLSKKDGFVDRQINPLNFISVPRYSDHSNQTIKKTANIETGGTYTVWK